MNETTQKRQGNFLTRLVRKQIFIPLAALLLLIVFNLIADPSFFAITLKENSLGDLVLTGNLITILDNASELVILAIGMTLVTAASGGQDISVGSAIAIAGSVVLRVLCGTNSRPDTLQAPIIVAFLACCVVSMLFRRVQRHACRRLQDPADGRDPDPLYRRPLHRRLDQQQRAAHDLRPVLRLLRQLPAGRGGADADLHRRHLHDPRLGAAAVHEHRPVLAGCRHQRQRRAAQRHPSAVREVPDLRHPRPVRGRGGLYQGQPLLHHQLLRRGQGHRDGRDLGRRPRRQRALRRQVQHLGLRPRRICHPVPHHHAL